MDVTNRLVAEEYHGAVDGPGAVSGESCVGDGWIFGVDVCDCFQEGVGVVSQGHYGERLGHDGFGRVGFYDCGGDDAVGAAAAASDREIEVGVLACVGCHGGAVG